MRRHEPRASRAGAHLQSPSGHSSVAVDNRMTCERAGYPRGHDARLRAPRDLYGTRGASGGLRLAGARPGLARRRGALAAAEAEVGVVPPAAAVRIAAEADAARFDLAALREGDRGLEAPARAARSRARRALRRGRRLGALGRHHTGHHGYGARPPARVGARADRARPRARAACGRGTCGALSRYADGRSNACPACRPDHVRPQGGDLGGRARPAAERLAVRRRPPRRPARRRSRHARDLGDDAAAVQDAFCRRLGLPRPDVHWHATRDRLRDLGHALSESRPAAERIAAEVIRLQSTEIAEVFEPATEAHVGSSTMPQKRNPMTCEYLVASARLLRGSTGVLVASPAHACERDMGYWAAEWLALPQALILAGGIADKLAARARGAGGRSGAACAANLDLTRGADHGRGRDDGARPGSRPRAAHALVLAAPRGGRPPRGASLPRGAPRGSGVARHLARRRARRAPRPGRLSRAWRRRPPTRSPAGVEAAR